MQITKVYKKIAVLLILINLTLISSREIWAQESGGDSGTSNVIENSMQDLSVVAGSGIAGAILGLSTLSFVSSPKSHMRHILIGGSIGIIIGVGFIAYSQATKSQDRIFKGGKSSKKTAEFIPSSRYIMKEMIDEQFQSPVERPMSLVFNVYEWK